MSKSTLAIIFLYIIVKNMEKITFLYLFYKDDKML